MLTSSFMLAESEELEFLCIQPTKMNTSAISTKCLQRFFILDPQSHDLRL